MRSNLYDGAAVSALTVGATGLEVFAEAYPIGLVHRWISPLDAADFDGDGVMEVAAMVAPHLQGVPSFYNREGQRLKRFATAPGFSTHYINSSVLGMSVILDAHSDGRPGIVLPSLDRDTLYTVDFDDPSKLKIIETVHHDSKIMTAIAATDIDRQGGADIMYGLDSGAIILIRR